MEPLTPRFTVATEKTPVPPGPGMLATPVWVRGAARATMYGTPVADPDSKMVVSPEATGAGTVLAQVNVSSTSEGAKALVGVNSVPIVCCPPPGMLTGVLGAPVTWLVAGLVVWKRKFAASDVGGAMVQRLAYPGPLAIIVANAVAGFPTTTDRLMGKTAAASVRPIGDVNTLTASARPDPKLASNPA